MKISIIDTETTGLSPADGKVIEIAVVNFDANLGEIIEAKSFLVNNATAEEIEKTKPIHGISPAIVHEYGLPLADAHNEVLKMVDGSSAILAHNADFDRQWFPANWFSNKWVCTQDDIEWPHPSSSKSLVAIALAHDVAVASAHRAMDDAMIIARLMKRVREKHILVDMITRGMRPKAMFRALVSYDDRELAKAAGFRWDGATKTWSRKMAVEDAAKLGFKTVQVDKTN